MFRRLSLVWLCAISLALALCVLVAGSTSLLQARQAAPEAANGWRHKLGAGLSGVARSSDRVRYLAWLRHLSVALDSGKQLGNFECRVRFTLDGSSQETFLVRFPTDLEAQALQKELESRSPVGLGDFQGYVFNYYDKGATVSASGPVYSLDKNVFVLRAAGEVVRVVDGVLQHVATTAMMLFEPADRGAAAAALQKLGYTSQTTRWNEMGAIYDELRLPRYRLALFREAPALAVAPDRVTVFLRHDIDRTLYGALAMGREERRRGLCSSYFVNMASSLYGLVGPGGQYMVRDGAVEDLLELQAMGHEIGYHTDILMMALFYDTPFRPWLDRELGRLRRAGVRLVSQAEHGSFHTHEIKSHNSYSFTNFRHNGGLRHGGLEATAPNGFDGVVRYERKGVAQSFSIPDVQLKDVGIEVSAYVVTAALGFTPRQWRYIPDQMLFQGKSPSDMLELLRQAEPGDVVEVLMHPVHWTVTDPAFDLGGDAADAQ